MTANTAERRIHRPEMTGTQSFAQLFATPAFSHRQVSRVELDIHRSVLFGDSPQIGTLVVEPKRKHLMLRYQPQSTEESETSWEASIGREGDIQSVLGIGRTKLDGILSLLVDVKAEPGKPQFQKSATEIINEKDMRLVSLIHIEGTATIPRTGE